MEPEIITLAETDTHRVTKHVDRGDTIYAVEQFSSGLAVTFTDSELRGMLRGLIADMQENAFMPKNLLNLMVDRAFMP